MLARRRRSSRRLPVSKAVPHTRQSCCSSETCELSSMTKSGDRAGLPETGTGTPQRSGHRFVDGRTAASAHRARRPWRRERCARMKGTASQPHHTCRREEGKRSDQAGSLQTAGDVRDRSRMAATRHGARGVARRARRRYAGTNTAKEVPYFRICHFENVACRAALRLVWIKSDAKNQHQQQFSKNWYQTGMGKQMKKACYVKHSRLFNNHEGFLVGRVGLEPTTKGL